jgi:ABC-type nitrate/sulfonate/bicarbonate transport system substrate-binding protein
MEAARAVLGPDATVTPLFAAATNEWVEANPDAIDGWVASLQAAADYIVENEEDARRILQEYTELPEAVADTTPLYGHDIGPVTAEQIGVWIEIVEGAGGLEQELEPEQFIVTS